MTARPLAGVTVLEMGTFITGPAAGMLLADLGADVIKVEQPGTGDPFRSFKGELYSPHFQTYNRNKRSIAIDPKIAFGRPIVRRVGVTTAAIVDRIDAGETVAEVAVMAVTVSVATVEIPGVKV